MKLKGVQAQPWSTVYLQIDLKNATITFEDGTGTPNTLDITIGEGNLVWTEARNIEYVLDRGLLDEVREGDQIPVELTIDILWEFLTAVVSTAGIPSPEDFFHTRLMLSCYMTHPVVELKRKPLLLVISGMIVFLMTFVRVLS